MEVPIVGIGGILNTVCLIALLFWKKWGVYGAVASAVFAFVVDLVVGLHIAQTVFGVASIAVIYGLLQIGGDRKGWTQLG